MWLTRLVSMLAIVSAAASSLAQAPPLPPQAVAQPPSSGRIPTQVTRMVVFSIPFAPPADVYPRAVEVQLFVSDDGGRNWRLVNRANPSRKQFTFRAPRDGDYFFSVRTLNEAGQVTPATRPRPELRVVVDTVAPKFKLRTWQDERGELHAAWELDEPHLRPDSLKLMYNSGAGNEPWLPVAVQGVASRNGQPTGENQFTWHAALKSQKYFVRAEVTDLAGNTFVTEQEVLSGGQLAAGTASPPGAVASPPAPVVTPPAEVVAAVPVTQPWSPESPGTDPVRPAPPMASTFPVSSTTQANAPATNLANQQSQAPVTTEELPAPTASAAVVPPAVDATVAPPVASNQPAAVSANPVAPSQPEVAPAANPSPQSAASAGLPPGVQPRMVNSRRFELEYDVESVGPTGIGRVELWGTRDSGQSWLNFGAPPDQRNPLQVTVEGEGLYGFRIVVYSGSGLGGLPPKSGDQPDIWLLVDLTKPQARILSAEQGTENRAGELLVSWEASDQVLAARPISLSFSSQPDGPWSTIAAGLPNTGAYVWRLDNRVPDIVYLRMDVRDESGNVQTVDFSQPLSIYRQRPAGRIVNVRPIVVPDSAP